MREAGRAAPIRGKTNDTEHSVIVMHNTKVLMRVRVRAPSEMSSNTEYGGWGIETWGCLDLLIFVRRKLIHENRGAGMHVGAARMHRSTTLPTMQHLL
jgi:hypothetical protein